MCKRIKFWLCKLLYSHRKKSCCISFSSKGFKVITLYRIFEGCQVEDKPIIFLPATASEEELANAIFFCLGKSSMVIRTSINSTSAYLKFIKERSLKSYYFPIRGLHSKVECSNRHNSFRTLATS